MRGCIGFLIMLIGGSGLDTQGNAWYIAAGICCLGLALMASENRKEEK